MKTFYITTPIYYANSEPHLGHLYTTTVADVVQRYKQQRGFETLFLTGTDEHGINIERAAISNHRTPQAQVDFIADKYKKLYADFNLNPENGGYDIFMRTTEPFHYKAVQELWREISKNKTPKGNSTIYKGFYHGWFCAACAEYKTETEYIVGSSYRLIGSTGDLMDIIIEAYRDNLISLEVKDLLIKKVLELLSGQKELLIRVKDVNYLAKSIGKLPENKLKELNALYNEKNLIPFLKTIKEISNYLSENQPLIKEVFSSMISYFDKAFRQDDFAAPLCKIHEKSLELVVEESYFFRLSDYGEVLLEKIENNTNLVRPEARRNEIVSFIKGGLQDLSISRETKSVSWGVPVPDDENHVMYVWLDALSNYITAIGWGNEERAEIGFEKFWQNVTHFVGKDILRFHTVYWFSFLMAANIDLPKTVYAHGMWLDGGGRKMGKTLGNVIEPKILKEFFQVDALRYFLLREMSFGQDGKFSYENFIERANADLAKGLGNLSSRTLSMITKYCDGIIPDGTIHEQNFIFAKRAGVGNDEQELASILELARDEFLRKFDEYDFSSALETIWSVIARIDKMISDAKPWELVKDEKQAETLNAVLYRATETLRWLCVLLAPVMPESMQEIYEQIGLDGEVSKINPADLKWGELKPGTRIGETKGVFPRLDKVKILNEINEQMEKNIEQKLEEKGVEVGKHDEQKTEDNLIKIDDFIKVELKVGEILEAEKVEKSDKLLKFKVDVGEDQPRQILAGIAQHYEPENLIGKKIIVVANLKPRKMMGLESNGMVCAASVGDGDKPVLATVMEDAPNGARLR